MSDDLDRQLHQEAAAMTPTVDDALHARVMSRVHAARRAKLASDTEPRRRPVPRAFWRLTGVALVAALALTVWLARSPARSTERMEIEPVVASLRETAEPIRARFMLPMKQAERQIALLKDDAESLGAFVTAQFDLLPTAPENSPAERPL